MTFRLAANPGDPPQPMARVASGGELARAMLALRLVLTEAPDTLLFDEVDAGVGGEAALAVGGALARLGERHQVLVVTHLAQVAAFADHQIVVDKLEEGGRALARARPVDGEARVIELARMLSGMSESGSARRHALELLDGARAPERTGRGALVTTPSDADRGTIVQAPVRIGRRTKDLVKQLLPGEIAVIDHADLDRVAAESLVEADAAAVLQRVALDDGSVSQLRPAPRRGCRDRPGRRPGPGPARRADRRRRGHRGRQRGLAGGRAAGHRAATRGGRAREPGGAGPSHPGGRAGEVRHQHAPVPPARTSPGHRRPGPSARAGVLQGPPRPGGGAGGRLPRGPRRAQAVRLPAGGQAGEHRRRRRGRRAARAAVSSRTSSWATSTRCPTRRSAAAPS